MHTFHRQLNTKISYANVALLWNKLDNMKIINSSRHRHSSIHYFKLHLAKKPVFSGFESLNPWHGYFVVHKITHTHSLARSLAHCQCPKWSRVPNMCESNCVCLCGDSTRVVRECMRFVCGESEFTVHIAPSIPRHIPSCNQNAHFLWFVQNDIILFEADIDSTRGDQMNTFLLLEM